MSTKDNSTEIERRLKPDIAAPACNPNIWEVQAGELQVWGQPGLQSGVSFYKEGEGKEKKN
jgi:hypothetical protein